MGWWTGLGFKKGEFGLKGGWKGSLLVLWMNGKTGFGFKRGSCVDKKVGKVFVDVFRVIGSWVVEDVYAAVVVTGCYRDC